jgi:hypothetical protein
VAGRNQASESPETAHRLVRALLGQFQALHGTTTCEQLIGCRLDTPEGHQYFKDNQIRETKCRLFTREAAGMVSALLDEEQGRTAGKG